MLLRDCLHRWNLGKLTAESDIRSETTFLMTDARIVHLSGDESGGTDVALEVHIHREFRLCECWAVNSLVTSRHSSFVRERLPRPPHCSTEGATGESCPLMFYQLGCSDDSSPVPPPRSQRGLFLEDV